MLGSKNNDANNEKILFTPSFPLTHPAYLNTHPGVIFLSTSNPTQQKSENQDEALEPAKKRARLEDSGPVSHDTSREGLHFTLPSLPRETLAPSSAEVEIAHMLLSVKGASILHSSHPPVFSPNVVIEQGESEIDVGTEQAFSQMIGDSPENHAPSQQNTFKGPIYFDSSQMKTPEDFYRRLHNWNDDAFFRFAFLDTKCFLKEKFKICFKNKIDVELISGCLLEWLLTRNTNDTKAIFKKIAEELLRRANNPDMGFYRKSYNCINACLRVSFSNSVLWNNADIKELFKTIFTKTSKRRNGCEMFIQILKEIKSELKLLPEEQLESYFLEVFECFGDSLAINTFFDYLKLELFSEKVILHLLDKTTNPKKGAAHAMETTMHALQGFSEPNQQQKKIIDACIEALTQKISEQEVVLKKQKKPYVKISSLKESLAPILNSTNEGLFFDFGQPPQASQSVEKPVAINDAVKERIRGMLGEKKPR